MSLKDDMEDSQRRTLAVDPQRIRQARQARGLSQKRVGTVLGVHEAHYRHVERGSRGLSVEKLILLAELLDVSIDWLCGRTKVKQAHRAE